MLFRLVFRSFIRTRYDTDLHIPVSTVPCRALHVPKSKISLITLYGLPSVYMYRLQYANRKIRNMNLNICVYQHISK